MENHVVIMAGGIGSRFWPMSTPDMPKQFIDVLGCGKSLIQMTAERFSTICPAENIWVVTGEAHVDIVKEQLPEIPEGNILAEPAARNTAPCIAYACWKIRSRIGREGKANIVVTPSDALVLDVEEYRKVISAALVHTAGSASIVTVGIKPNRPETGYGYIEVGNGDGIFKVDAFKEKPDLQTAQGYLQTGKYLWNAGIFVWNCDTIESELRTHAPQICAVMDRMADKEFSTEAVKELFPTCEKISIDYAVMEKAGSIFTIPGDFGWSDLGTWGSLWQNCAKDTDDNAVVAQEGTVLYDCKECVVHISDLKNAVIQGLEGYIVAEKDGRLLICRLDQEQRIKDFKK